MDEVLQTSAVLALSKELITAGQDSPQCDKCDSKMVQKTQREIKRRDETNEGEIKRRDRKKKKLKCGETERDSGRSMEALVA